MKILFCLGEHYKNKIAGAEIQSILLASELQKLGNEVFYICKGKYFSNKPFIDDYGIKIFHIKKPFKNIKTLHYLHIHKIYSLLNTIKPDIIYQRGDYHFIDIISTYGKERGIPVVSALSMERHCHKQKVYLSPSLIFQIINSTVSQNLYPHNTIPPP